MERIDDYQDFFSRRAWLRYTWTYAKALRISPWALAGALLARTCALTPPNVVAQVTADDMPMTLNLLVALVGPTGSGKGKAMAHARHLIPAPMLSALVEVKPKTGESIPAKYVSKIPAVDADGKQIKGEYTDKVVSDRLLVFMPEIVSMRAAMSRQGSTLLPSLLESFSNEPLGDDTKGKQYQLKLPAYAYRLAAVVGVQPSNSGTLFDETQTGLAGRFLYLPSTDHDMPALDDKPARPITPFPFDAETLPEGNSYERVEALIQFGQREAMPQHGETGYPLTALDYPHEAAVYADRQQVLSCSGRSDPLDSHRLELVARVAALLRLMEHDGLTVTTDDWNLADVLVRKSDMTRDECREQRRSIATEERADRYAADNEARDRASEKRMEVVKRRVLSALDKHDPSREGIKGYQIRQKCGKYGPDCYTAIEALYEEGKVEQVGESTDSTSSTLWALSPDIHIHT